jgi:hypothetical protein
MRKVQLEQLQYQPKSARNAHRVSRKELVVIFLNSSCDTSGIQYQDNGLSIVPEDFRRFRNYRFFHNASIYETTNFHNSATMGYDAGLYHSSLKPKSDKGLA